MGIMWGTVYSKVGPIRYPINEATQWPSVVLRARRPLSFFFWHDVQNFYLGFCFRLAVLVCESAMTSIQEFTWVLTRICTCTAYPRLHRLVAYSQPRCHLVNLSLSLSSSQRGRSWTAVGSREQCSVSHSGGIDRQYYYHITTRQSQRQFEAKTADYNLPSVVVV